MNLILFGFKGVGKTYFGKRLSEQLQLPFVDTDDLIEKKHEVSVRTLYKNVGEERFREIEREIFLEIGTSTSHIIALGGGFILDPEMQKRGLLVYLKASFETVLKRILKGGIPAYADAKDPIGSLRKKYLERIPIYESIPAKCVDVDGSDELSSLNQLRGLWRQTLSANSFE